MIGACPETAPQKNKLAGIIPPFLKAHFKRLKVSPLGYRLAKGAFWSLAGNAISRASSFLATVIVARMLGKEQFGGFGIIQSTIGVLSPLAGFGLGVTATKYVAEFRETTPSRAGRILKLSGLLAWLTGGVAGIVLLFVAPLVAVKALGAPELAPELRIGSLLVLFGAVNGAQTGALAGFEAFKQITFVNLWSGLAYCPFVVLGCWLSGLSGAVWGLTAGTAFACILNRWAIVQEARRYTVPLSESNWLSEMPILWNFSLFAVIGPLISFSARWFANAIVVRSPDGLRAIATCSVATQFQTLVIFLSGICAQAAMPIMADLISKGNRSEFNRFFLKNFAINILLCLGFTLPLLLFLDPLIKLYGAAYSADKFAIFLFLPAAILLSAASFSVQALICEGSIKITSVNSIVWSIALVLTVVFLKSSGAVRMAIGNIIAYSLYLVIPLVWLWLKRRET